jgi:hypothetical protein
MKKNIIIILNTQDDFANEEHKFNKKICSYIAIKILIKYNCADYV